ncbi:MAG: hypothetical protein AAB416_05160, partial [Patescibacteria group bacterium]
GSVLALGFISIQPALAETERGFNFFTAGPTLERQTPLKFFWSSPGAGSCTASGDWSGLKPAAGSESIPLPSRTSMVTIRCGNVSKSLTIFVSPGTVPFRFQDAPSHVILQRGEQLELRWSAPSRASSCSLDLNGLRVSTRGNEGSERISPQQIGRYQYSIECAVPGQSESISGRVIATVYDDAAPHTVNVVQARLGDAAGAFTVVSIQPLNPFVPTSSLNAQVHLKGRTTLTGLVRYHAQNDANLFVRSRVCMEALDYESARRFPELAGVGQLEPTRFCFRNDSLAQEIFSPGGSARIASVVVDGVTLIGDWEVRPHEAYLINEIVQSSAGVVQGESISLKEGVQQIKSRQALKSQKKNAAYSSKHFVKRERPVTKPRQNRSPQHPRRVWYSDSI